MGHFDLLLTTLFCKGPAGATSNGGTRSGSGRQFYAIKHLVPTSCPDRVLTEVECLRRAGGEANVLPLLFVHR